MLRTPPDREFWVVCAKCGRLTCHRAVAYVANHECVSGTMWHDDYFVLRCEGCHDICFFHESSSDDSYSEDPETGLGTPDVTQHLYPPRLAGIRSLQEVSALPRHVRRVYLEVIAAINAEWPILAGAGIRMIVEAVAKQEKADGKNLEQKIDDLKAKGFITPIGAELLHDLRFMGNAATHEVKAHTQEELAAALRVIDHLLTEVYVLAPNHRSRKADA